MSLEQLKTIRSRRMEQCFIELQEQKRVLQKQQQGLQQKEQQLENFAKWRLEHQEALFASLKNQPFAPQMLFDYQKNLEDLRLEEERLRAELSDAYQGLQTAETNVQTAQNNSSEANLKLEKLKEIIKTQDAKNAHEESVQ
ncbi:YscO family type III secretion system apparatus protein [Thiothrix lacustris]|uniref:YscO family type III secretion system apparatus protein n=1 Tax=Thiothrix lacustris TaxID=525917 RepID=A0ABY9MVF4_9GAMM|nr:YscO family type III secretion system apparatus protein [Thiothrix lacustris]WML91816.1 YscO family type III secretion system apparatus protein [Thiothrix lacustris]